MMQVEHLTLPEAKATLKSLRSYQDISKKVGKRGKAIFKRKMDKNSVYIVEYFPNVDEDFAFTHSLPVFKKFFDCTPSKEEVSFVKKESLLWGMKVYKDDSLVDLSFKRVVNKLKL